MERRLRRVIFQMRNSDPYFDWLCIMIGANRRPYDYTELLSNLHEKIFQPKLRMDANRGGDGLALRVEFISEHGPWGSSTNRGPCTMLEFLVALAKRMSFLMYGEGNHGYAEHYFWKLIDNLGLSKCTDDKWFMMNGEFFVEDAVCRVNERLYSADGTGGLFPLRGYCTKDQRAVEIWYQMQSWLMENSEVGNL